MNINKVRVASLFLLVSSYLPVTGQLLSQGPNNPVIMSYEFFGCLGCPGSDWLNSSNAMAPDSLYATAPLQAYPNCFQSVCFYARGLLATDFKFNVPPNAIISGITVHILRKGHTSGAIRDSAVMLLKNGMTAGAIKAGPDPWPLMPQYITYGDSLDTWGAAWTPAEINSNQFGVNLRPMNKSGAFDSASVDHIQVTIYYSQPVSVPEKHSAGIAYYFNSGESILYLHDPGAADNLIVYDISGRKVFNSCCRAHYDLGMLDDGIYIAVLDQGSVLGPVRFVKATLTQ